jgi:hypothetical protein
MKNGHDTLHDFVSTSLAKGLTRDQITGALHEAKWPKDQVENALSEFVECEFPVPVPSPRIVHSARETFFYLLLFTTLILSAYNLGALLFYQIEIMFPDPARDQDLSKLFEFMRWAAAYVIVALPAYLFLSVRMNRSLRLDPIKRRSSIRKWLTYTTLFVASAFVIGDLIALFFNLLSGEFTLRFILKVLTIGLISGAVFAYYYSDLQRDEDEAM